MTSKLQWTEAELSLVETRIIDFNWDVFDNIFQFWTKLQARRLRHVVDQLQVMKSHSILFLCLHQPEEMVSLNKSTIVRKIKMNKIGKYAAANLRVEAFMHFHADTVYYA